MVSLNTFGTAVDRPPYIKISIVELDSLYQASSRLCDLTLEYSVMAKNDSIKSLIIVKKDSAIALKDEELESYKVNEEIHDNNMKAKDDEIARLNKKVKLRDIVVVAAILFGLLLGTR